MSLGYRTDLALLQLGGSDIEDRGDHLIVRSPHNPGHWWGNFVLVGQPPTVETSERWLACFDQAFPTTQHVAIGFDATDGSVSDLSWFAGHGFNAEAATVLTASSVGQPAARNGLASYRRLTTNEDWAQSVELRMRCDDVADPVAHRAFVVAKVATNRALVEAGHGGWFGAFIDGQLVAQLGLFAAAPLLARFQSVETDPDYRRQGLAGQLVYRAAVFGFGELGVETLVIVADPNYFAIDLYRSLGFTPVESQLQIELAQR